ncbi:hypothetical protein [Haloarcula sp. JP-L23]|uniref:hypothetical protein n=1 Tax=Haloarcula sp. JP-L23 TaxID=2716717 RepID=UPI00140F4998|nr:hypothetical protein G9465_06930 [Haloarcula sp. JP-L23]
MSVANGKSESQIRMELLDLQRTLQQMGRELTNGHIGGYLQLASELDLDTIASDLEGGDVEYDPTVFPAVFYDIATDPLTVVIFSDGRLCVVDGSSDAAVRGAILETAERLGELGVYTGDRPAEDAVVVVNIPT